MGLGIFCRPLRGLAGDLQSPTAHAVGFALTPLRGCRDVVLSTHRKASEVRGARLISFTVVQFLVYSSWGAAMPDIVSAHFFTTTPIPNSRN